jgi:hypothetical protein
VDTQRLIRFLYPPIFFVGWVCLGITLDPNVSPEKIFSTYLQDNVPSLVTAVVGSAALAVAGGYLIGSANHLLIWVMSFSGLIPFVYDAEITDRAVRRMRRTLRVPKDAPDHALPVIASFDHGLMHENVSRWINRRWQMLHTALNSASAVFLGLAVWWIFLDVQEQWGWYVFSWTTIAIFLFNAWQNWKNVRQMLELQSFGPFPPAVRSNRDQGEATQEQSSPET